MPIRLKLARSIPFAKACLGSFALALAVALLVRYQSIPAILNGTLQDPDSYMRLVRIQDALDSGHWFGNAVLRDASGQGVVLPWSHLLDGLILLLRAPLRLVMAPAPALFWAAILTAPVLMGTLGAACAWAAAPLASRAWLWTAPFAAAVSPAILNYGEVGFVTHHIALVAAVVAAWGAAGRAAFGDIKAAAAAGVLVGIGIWISPEAMPYGMMALGGVGLAWLLRPSRAAATACLVSALALWATIAVALLLDPPPGGINAVALDRLSLPFLVLAALATAVFCLPLVLTRRPIRQRALALAAATVAAAAAWLMLFPGFRYGLAGLMTAAEAAAFFDHIQEMAPLNTPGPFTLFALPGTLAAATALCFAARPGPTWQRSLWLYAGACGVACVALAVTHLRFSPYAAAGAAVMLPILLHRLDAPALLAWRPVLRPALLAAFLCAPGLVGRALISPAQADETASVAAYEAQCRVSDAAALLKPYAGTVILAHVDDGPELLYRTRAAIVGSLYHPNIAGYMRLRAAWRTRNLVEPPPELLATGADAILICPHHQRMALVDGPATTLFDRLNAAAPPAWLHPEPGQPNSPWTLYRLRPLTASPG